MAPDSSITITTQSKAFEIRLAEELPSLRPLILLFICSCCWVPWTTSRCRPCFRLHRVVPQLGGTNQQRNYAESCQQGPPTAICGRRFEWAIHWFLLGNREISYREVTCLDLPLSSKFNKLVVRFCDNFPCLLV